jgi:hypothetical protein
VTVVMAEYPADLTPALSEVLGLMIFTTGPLAHAFRAAGENIPPKAEAEQAFVLHWLIGLALQHGSTWRSIAVARIEELQATLKAGEGDRAADQV